MAIIESTGGTAMSVDPLFNAARVSVRPPESLSWVSVSSQSGALTGLTGPSPVMSFRNLSGNPILVRRVGIGFICTTGFTAAQTLAWGLIVARAFTTSDSGGTAISLTGNNCKHRTSLGTLTSIDLRMASTSALTAGTRTLDANYIAQTGTYAPATTAGVLIAPSPNNLFGHDPEDYPLVLAQNEGFNIMSTATMGAGGAGIVFANLEIAEASAF